MKEMGIKYMVTLYITRHGETEWNTEKRMQGWQNSNLTENGVQKAKLLGEKLKDTHFDAIYSSPSGRTKETASLIRGERKIPLFYDELLKEIHMGAWEGKQISSIKELYPKEHEAFWNMPHLYQQAGAETFKDVQNRASAFLAKMEEQHQTGDILIVTHTVVIKCLLSIFKNLPIERLWDPPYIHDTCLTIVEWTPNGANIVLEADMSHLKDIINR